jgi:hypothetical protein
MAERGGRGGGEEKEMNAWKFMGGNSRWIFKLYYASKTIKSFLKEL